MNNINEVAWVEKYRPQKIKDCILPSSIKKTFQNIVDSGTLANHFILAGRSGGGKTTTALALGNELEMDILLKNASDERNIDVLRTDVRDFCSTRSFDGKRKMVIFDEGDNLNPNSTQPALRGFMEEFSSNVSFIYTANNLSKILEPIRGRCAVIEWNIPATEAQDMAKQFFARVKFILNSESVKYEPKVIASAITKWWPDFRRTINELQRHSMSGSTPGVITEEILGLVKDIPMAELVSAIKDDNFKLVRTWCALNSDGDCIKMLRKLYDNCYDIFAEKSLPELIVLIGKYQNMNANALDNEMLLCAAITEIMLTCEVKK